MTELTPKVRVAAYAKDAQLNIDDGQVVAAKGDLTSGSVFIQFAQAQATLALVYAVQELTQTLTENPTTKGDSQ